MLNAVCVCYEYLAATLAPPIGQLWHKTETEVPDMSDRLYAEYCIVFKTAFASLFEEASILFWSSDDDGHEPWGYPTASVLFCFVNLVIMAGSWHDVTLLIWHRRVRTHAVLAINTRIMFHVKLLTYRYITDAITNIKDEWLHRIHIQFSTRSPRASKRFAA